MFGDINTVTLLGNVTREPELRFTTSGTPLLSFGLATNYEYKVGEEWKKDASFHDVVVWNRRAENLNKYIQKGTRLYIEGRIKYKTYEKEGVKKTKVEIEGLNVILLGKYKEPEAENTVVETTDLPF